MRCEGHYQIEHNNSNGLNLIIAEEKEEYDPSGKAVYLKMCTALGIVPASYFLRRIESGESSIEMAHHGVGPKGAKAIALSLTVSQNYNYFVLK